MARPSALSAEDVARGLAALPSWTGDTNGIERVVEAPTFLSGVRLVTDVARIAEEMDHHPDIDIRWRKVRFFLSTHDAGGVTELDLAQARRIDALAAAL
ncbi:MAG TPA: 4a-hydroxytetrahydrobiopterin dehydratase [Mycobacteriales bacterium]|nr:4a-hydroxytetrahydrobiopterin dehydratase [Mycobacteriales bacterium]